MSDRSRKLGACVAIAGIFLSIQVGALALVGPFQEEGHQVVENTGDPTLSFAYVGAILVVTGVMLVAMRYGGDAVLRLAIIFSASYIALFVFRTVFPAPVTLSVGGATANPLAWGGAAAVGLGLYLYPEWYVIDATGIVMGVGGAGLFGINFGILPALVLLVVLAVYDAVSVYGTEHMLTLASGVMDMRVPVVLVIPLTLSYSYLDADDPVADEATEPPTAAELRDLGPEGVAEVDEERLAALDEETVEDLDEDLVAAINDALPGRDALYIGLGDAVIPTVLVASAAFFLEVDPAVSVAGVTANVPALGAIVGTMAGLAVLLWMVLRGRAHAGLPLLNGGAIGGYLLGALVSGLSLVDALGLSGLV